MISLPIFVLIFIIFGILKWYKLTRIPKNFPPGPIGMPFIGHLNTVRAKTLVEGFEKLHSKYGAVFSVNLGPTKRCVVIGNYELLQECMRSDLANQRPPHMNWMNKEFRHGNGTDARGLIFSQGQEWMEQRKFLMKTFRNYGVGSSTMHKLIQDEVLGLLNWMKKSEGQAVNAENLFNISIFNTLWMIIAGEKFKLDDEKLLDIVAKLDRVVSNNSNRDLVRVWPPIRYLAPEKSGWNRAQKLVNDVIAYIKPYIEDHKRKWEENPESQCHDIIDAYLNKIKEDENSFSSSFHGTLGLHNLESSLLDLMFAGNETTSTAITWGILLMIHNPKIQENVQLEILRTVGPNRLPDLSYRSEMSYTQAVLEEVLRFGCNSPFGVPHSTSQPIRLGDFDIPEETTIFTNLHQIMFDPENFPEPHRFNPERHLDKLGNFKRNEKNVAFGIGKRDCLGKALAMDQLFLFFTAILQCFTFKSVDPKNLPTLEPRVGFTRSPEPYQMLFHCNSDEPVRYD